MAAGAWLGWRNHKKDLAAWESKYEIRRKNDDATKGMGDDAGEGVREDKA